jgi:hypothetical protein
MQDHDVHITRSDALRVFLLWKKNAEAIKQESRRTPLQRDVECVTGSVKVTVFDRGGNGQK